MQAAKTIMSGLIWRGLYYVSAFIINILIARFFEASLSGTVYYLSSIYAFVLLLSSLSIDSGIIYFSANGQVPVARLYYFSLAWSVIIGAAVGIVVYLYPADVSSSISADLLIFSAVSFISGNMLMTYCSGFFYAHNNFKLPNLIYVVGTGFLVLVIPFNGHSIIPYINLQNYFYIYFGTFLVQGIIMALAAKLRYVHSGYHGFLSSADIKLLLNYCGLAFAGNIIYFLLYRIDYWFVERYCSTELLGNYIQVSKLGHLFFIIPTILASVMLPITAAGKQAGINHLITLLCRTILFVYLIACMLLVLTGSWLFPLVFGSSFNDMYTSFLFLIPGILSLSGLFTLTAYFAGRNKLKLNIYGSLLALLVVLAGDILFIPRYGIIAAAGVSSVGYIVYQVFIIYHFKKEYKTALSEFFIFRFSDFKKLYTGITRSINK